MRMSGDIVREAIEAGLMAKPWEWSPKHPQLIDGALYLLQSQWDAICEAFPIVDDAEGRWDHQNRPMLCWGIPVKLIAQGGQVALPDGRLLIHSTVMGALYIIDQRGLRQLSPWSTL